MRSLLSSLRPDQPPWASEGSVPCKQAESILTAAPCSALLWFGSRGRVPCLRGDAPDPQPPVLRAAAPDGREHKVASCCAGQHGGRPLPGHARGREGPRGASSFPPLAAAAVASWVAAAEQDSRAFAAYVAATQDETFWADSDKDEDTGAEWKPEKALSGLEKQQKAAAVHELQVTALLVAARATAGAAEHMWPGPTREVFYTRSNASLQRSRPRTVSSGALIGLRLRPRTFPSLCLFRLFSRCIPLLPHSILLLQSSPHHQSLPPTPPPPRFRHLSSPLSPFPPPVSPSLFPAPSPLTSLRSILSCVIPPPSLFPLHLPTLNPSISIFLRPSLLCPPSPSLSTFPPTVSPALPLSPLPYHSPSPLPPSLAMCPSFLSSFLSSLL